MEKIHVQRPFATVYLVEFASGKIYVDVTCYGQSPEAHIDQLLRGYREASAIVSAYFLNEDNLGPVHTPQVSAIPTSPARSLSNLADQMSGPLQITDAREKCGKALFKAAFIHALLTEPYEISPISTVYNAPSSIMRPDLEAKYKLVRSVRSFMPFGLNGYNVPGFLHDFKWLVERDAALGSLHGFLHQDILLANIVLLAAYFKTLSPRRLRPIIQFIPVEKYSEKTEQERDLATAVLLSTQDLLRGYKDVSLTEPIAYETPRSSSGLHSISLSDIFKSVKNANPVRLRLPYGDTGLFVPWRLYASTSLAKKGLENFMRARSGVPSALSHAANASSTASYPVAYGSVWRWLPVSTPVYTQYPELL